MSDVKKTTSIARRMNAKWMAELFSAFLCFNILVTVMVIGGWCYLQETSGGEDFRHHENRGLYRIVGDGDIPNTDDQAKEYENYRKQSISSFDLIKDTWFGKQLQRLKYVYYNSDTRHEVYAGKFLVLVSNMLIYLIIIQLLIILVGLFTKPREIKRYLAPLDEMAKKTMILSSAAAFDVNRFHSLEDAISQISPTGANTKLETGDSDLEGLEGAINSLLERTRQSYQQQARFVSDASHELRTPIAVIQGYANMLDRWGKEDQHILEESITAIKSESDHMKTLVEQLLFLARGDSGRTKLTMETFSLSNVIREVYDESVMIDTQHKYVINSSPEDICVTGDLSMIKQAARILVDNAAKYTSAGAQITLSAKYNDKNEPCFIVQDEGIGIAESDVSQVFERFFRSDPARSREGGGTGLGLSIAKWIVDKHGGYFQVLSRQEIGTRITICLPPQ